jgi:erythronate-4-phosphate dehydrogenase
MKIVCSSDMPLVREAFSTLGEPVVMDGRRIGPEDVRDAELLAIRSTTRISAALLDGSAVRFVGTATIGHDHIDAGYLEQRGIRWCHSPGCNANSVAEYITAALLHLGDVHHVPLAGRTLGVVGVGNVGSRVVRQALALGMKVLCNDPPRARENPRVSLLTDDGPKETDLAYVPLDRVLEASDVVTMHVPLTREGGDRTFHLADAAFFERLKPGAVFINSARGPVVDTPALLEALDADRVSHAVIDTWEGEPRYSAALLHRATLVTPHIAGYSFEGKVTGTHMVYREACRFLDRAPDWTPDALLPPPATPRVEVRAAGRPAVSVLNRVVRRVYDIRTDDRRLREGCVDDPETRGRCFDRLRVGYPVRREFRFTEVCAPEAAPELRRMIEGIGFRPAG